MVKRVVRSGRGGSAARFVLPQLVVEIEPGFVVGARLDGRTRQLQRLAVRELEPHTVEPSPHRSNVASPEGLRMALHALAQVVGNGNAHCALLIPDGAVRVGILGFETLPDDPKDTQALLCWRMRENLPCPPEEANLAYQVLRREPHNVELLVVAVKNTVLREYEQLLEPMNASLALILPATISLLPLLPEESGIGELLLHVCSGWLSAVVLEGNRPRSWRTVELRCRAPEELVREAAVEAARVVASARDHLRLEIGRVWLCERPPAVPGLEEEVGVAVSKEVVRVSPAGGLSRVLSEAERPLFENFGTTVAGLITNAG